MPIWIEKTSARPYLCYHFSGTIVLDDLEHLASTEDPYFANLDDGECLGVIIDLSAIDTIASRLFPQLQQMRIMRDDYVCAICVVGANPYLRALAISLGLVRGKPDITFRQTSEEAVAVLDHRLQRASSDG